MSLIVQDDSGTVDDANGYITVAFFRSYNRDRCNDITDFDTVQIEGAIIRATDHLDTTFFFVGERINTDQRTQWPRLGVEDRDDRVRFGIPVEVKEATAEYTRIALQTNEELDPSPVRDDTGRVVQAKREKVGPIEESTTYLSGGTFELPQHPVADQKLTRSGLAVRGNELRRA